MSEVQKTYKPPSVHTRLRMWIALIVAAVLMVPATFGAMGCLNTEQLKVLRENQVAEAEVNKFLTGIEGEISRINALVASKKLDAKEGLSIVKALAKKKDEAIQVKEVFEKRIKAMKDAEMPWWAYIPQGLSILGSIVGSTLGIKKIGRITSAFGTLSRGIDNAIGENGMHGVIPPGATSKFLETLDDHAKKDGTRAILKSLHADATAGKI